MEIGHHIKAGNFYRHPRKNKSQRLRLLRLKFSSLSCIRLGQKWVGNWILHQTYMFVSHQSRKIPEPGPPLNKHTIICKTD
jgi:hypothetical protein